MHILKKSLFLLLVLLLTTSLCACTAGGTAETPPPAVTDTPEMESNTVSSSEAPSQTAGSETGEVTIQITPPEGWAPVAGSVLDVQYMKNTASFMVKAESFASDTLEAVVQEALGIYEGAFDNVEAQGEPEKITVDGRDAMKLVFTCDISNMKMEYEYVYLFAGGSIYVITFGDLTDTFNSLAADYEAILNSIQFIEQ